MAAPASDSSPSVPTPPGGSAPPPASPRRRWWIPALAAVVIVALIVAALFASGAIQLSRSSPASSPYVTFSRAESLASAEASSSGSSGWFAAFALGVATPTAVLEPTVNLTQVLSVVNCTAAWPGGEPANLDIPSTSVGAATGAAAFWVIGLKNASNDLLVELVSDGAASVLLTAMGTSCTSSIALLAPFPSNVIDSPAIVATANGAGGAGFLAAHPNATRVWGAYGGIQLGPLGSTTPEWSVDYTTCTLPPTEGQVGDVFNATIGGTSGAVINNSTGTETCLPNLPTGVGLTAHQVGVSAAVRKAI